MSESEYRSIPSTIGACAIAALNPVRPQKQNPAREEILKLFPQTLSSCSINGRHISSRHVDTRLIAVSALKPCFPRTLVTCLMRVASGTALGKCDSRILAYLLKKTDHDITGIQSTISYFFFFFFESDYIQIQV